MKRVLVTGGFGFLGSHLVEELMRHDQEISIHIVDDMSSSVIDHNQFLATLDPSRITFDIMTVKHYLHATKWESFDEIYHCASPVGPAGVLPNAGAIAMTIIDDAYALAKKSFGNDAPLLFVSTSEIYGGGTSKETDPRVISSDYSARLEYAVGKLAAEVALTNFVNEQGLNAVIVRPFNIAGPRQSAKGGFVIPRFVQQALKDEPITVFEDGMQVRAFTHVKDIALGIRLAQEFGVEGDAYNLGNIQNQTNMFDLAKRVIELTQSASEIYFVDPKEIYGESYRRANDKLPDASFAKRELGWEPTLSLDDIILDAIAWEKSR